MTHVSSWGKYPRYPQVPHQPYWQADIESLSESLTKDKSTTLPYGKGRSYGDSCLASSNHVIQTSHLNRFISVDWENGIMCAESGVTLADILAIAIPKGWFLPVTPGTKHITLGGAIANDVHGKNHHNKGTFGCHTIAFELIRSDQPAITCSKTENALHFNATIGGLGLTGIISWVKIKLLPIQSSNLSLTTIRFGSLTEFFALSNEMDAKHEYTVSWVDCLAKKESLGRGVFMAANHLPEGELAVEREGRLTVPFTPPISLINPVTLKAHNQYYYHKHRVDQYKHPVGYENFFYPLDGVLHWNRIYGRKGFQQYQCIIPNGQAEDVLANILKTIANNTTGSFLAVMKRCGDIASPGLLSFPFPGVSLALDFPQKAELEKSLFPQLNAILSEGGGRLYPAKDAHMTGEHFRSAYPEWLNVEKLRDPKLLSHFWKRVTTQ